MYSAFYWTDNENTFAKYYQGESLENNTLIVLKPYDSKYTLFSKQFNYQNLEEFYIDNRDANVHLWNTHFMRTVSVKTKPIVVLACKNSDSKLLSEYNITAKSPKQKNHVYFTHIDLTGKEAHPKARQIMNEFFNIQEKDMPTLRYINPGATMTDFNQEIFKGSY